VTGISKPKKYLYFAIFGTIPKTPNTMHSVIGEIRGGPNTKPKRICQEYDQVSTLSQHSRYWKNSDDFGFLEPVWPHEPDIDVARKLAVACLPPDLFADAEIGSFAQGSFHRVYYISSRLTAAKYLMRVALPVDPFFKTESEVATMEYIRRHSSIPVPRVVAYASSASNELGFEWILMEKVDGVPLDRVWDDMTFNAKTKFTVAFAGYMKQLRELQFPLFGSIYFVDIWNQVGYTPIRLANDHPPSSKALSGDIGINDSFVIGRIVATRFFRDKRLLLHTHRGPFETAHQLLMAETELLGRRIRHLSPEPGTDYYCEVDESLANDGPEVLEVFDKLHKVASTIVSPVDGSEDAKMLWHDDLSLMNILVDPKTYNLVGIVDWESVSVVPAWETASGVPDFLRGIDVNEPAPIGSLSEDEEKIMADLRKDWDLVLLRRKYAEILGPIYDVASASLSAVNLKLKLATSLGDFEERWTGTRYWTKKYFGSDDGSKDSSNAVGDQADP
jgi:aminoglycoside phosphotransferase (APT) family kinase protein